MDEHALGVFERKVLRTICGGVQMDSGMWRRRMNHELHAVLGEPTIANQAKIERLRWAECAMTVPSDYCLIASARKVAQTEEQEHSAHDGVIKLETGELQVY